MPRSIFLQFEGVILGPNSRAEVTAARLEVGEGGGAQHGTFELVVETQISVAGHASGRAECANGKTASSVHNSDSLCRNITPL